MRLNDRFIRLLAAVSFSLCACAPAMLIVHRPENVQSIKKIAVLPFSDDPIYPETGLKASQLLEAVMRKKLKTFEIMDGSAAREILIKERLLSEETDETGWKGGGGFNPLLAKDAAQKLGVGGVVVGSVMFQKRRWSVHPSAMAALSVRLVEAKSGDVVWAAYHDMFYHRSRMAGKSFAKMFLIGWLAGPSPSADKRLKQVVKRIVKRVSRELDK